MVVGEARLVVVLVVIVVKSYMIEWCGGLESWNQLNKLYCSSPILNDRIKDTNDYLRRVWVISPVQEYHPGTEG